MVFYGSVLVLNFRYMLVARYNIYNGPQISNAIPHGFKLVVGKDDGNSETSDVIYTYDSFEMAENGVFLMLSN